MLEEEHLLMQCYSAYVFTGPRFFFYLRCTKSDQCHLQIIFFGLVNAIALGLGMTVGRRLVNLGVMVVLGLDHGFIEGCYCWQAGVGYGFEI